MLNSITHLNGATITSTDGDIGHVKEAYFDDHAWAIRYLVVDSGTWLSERNVLISPYSILQPVDSGNRIAVALTREQVKHSPDIDTHQPVSRRREREYASYFAYPEYWGGDGLWAMGALPLLSGAIPASLGHDDDVLAQDVHLRSSEKVTGYDIQASDGSIGHVKDFVFDDESFAIRYLLVDTHNWWPGGNKVLVATHWIERIDWDEKKVYVNLTREQIKNSPAYEEAQPLDRAYEKRLHAAYDRQGYWD